MATLGGNLAHGDPANDHPATMLALDAEVVATGAKDRVIRIADFFVSLFTTALQPEEILTEIRIPAPSERTGGAYFKLERKVGDFATAAVAAQLTLNSDGSVKKIGIALTNVGPMPVKAKEAEDFLRGKRLDEANINKAAELAGDAAEPSSDLRGPAEYKKGLIREFTRRSLVRAAERAGK